MTIENLAEMKKQLTDLASVLNTFKSEAVQLRLLEFILGEVSVTENCQNKKARRPMLNAAANSLRLRRIRASIRLPRRKEQRRPVPAQSLLSCNF